MCLTQVGDLVRCRGGEIRADSEPCRAQQFALEALESRCLLSTITEYPTPKLTSGSQAQPGQIISAGGDIWFVEGGGAIGTVNPANPSTVVSYPQDLTNATGPQGITVGPDNNIWFSEAGGAIGKLVISSPSTVIQPYTQGLSAHALIAGLTSGPLGDIWFTDAFNNAIGLLNPNNSNSITEIPIPASLTGIHSFASEIIAGPGGKLYFTEANVNVDHNGAVTVTNPAIGIYNPSATTNQWSQVLLPGGEEPFGITVGPDHQSIWYTWETPTTVGSPPQSSGIGTFNALSPPTTVSASSSFPFTTPSGGVTTEPNGITSGPDGKLYITDTGNGAIYSFDPSSNVISQPNYVGKSVISNPLLSGITTGPDGNLWFTDDGTQAANATVSGAVGIVDRLAVTAQPPASVPPGVGFGLTVNIDTAGGKLDSSYNAGVTVALASNPGGSTLGGTLTVQAVNGVATFSGLTLNNLATGYTLRVTATGVSSAATTGFNVTAVSQATHLLTWTQPPSTVLVGTPFSVVIVALTSGNALASSYSGPVTLSLAASPPGASLGGTTTVAASGGIASFTGLSVNLPGTYVLLATASGLSSAGTAAITVPIPVLTPPQVQAATLVNQQKLKRGKPVGKPVLIGYQFTFDVPMSPSINNPSDYQVQVLVPAKGRGKTAKPAHYQATGFTLNLVSSNTVQVLTGSKTTKTFKNGGQIILIGSGLSSAAGALLGSNVVYTIPKGGRGIFLG